jgi:general stress protein YciG
MRKPEETSMAIGKRGFASMSEEQQREIASRGGKAAHLKGTAHKFTSEEAREAGRKGGESVSRDREHMAVIGREGGGRSRGGRARWTGAAVDGSHQDNGFGRDGREVSQS